MRSRCWRRLFGSNRGQSLIEFAMVLPLLLVVSFIIIEFGRAFWVKNMITEAARYACREAVVSSKATAPDVARQKAEEFLAHANMGPKGEYPFTADVVVLEDGIRHVVVVTLTTEFDFIPDGPLPTTPFAGSSDRINDLGAITIRAQHTMQAETF